MSQHPAATDRTPDLAIGGLALWVHGYEREPADPGDASWLRVTVHCGGTGASVDVFGSILEISDLSRFREQVLALQRDLKGEAVLDAAEPNLFACLRASPLGRIELEVQLTPDHLKQQHRFIFDLDQTYLGPLAAHLNKLLDRWPNRAAS